MKVLLIGGTGRLSRDTTELCIKQNYEVYLFNRGHHNDFTEQNVHLLIGDINDAESAARAIGDECFDVVVDYLTYTLDTLKKRIALLEKHMKQFVFISSATVYPIQDGIIDETKPIGNDGWIYARDKRLCEQYMRENERRFSFKYTIVRPYVTYDKKRIPFPIISKLSNWNLIYRISNGLPILMPGDGEQRVTLTSTFDFAVGIVGLFMNPVAYGQDFNIVGDVVATWNDLIRAVEAALGKKAAIVYVDTEELAKRVTPFAAEIKYDKAHSHLFDNGKIKQAVPHFATTIDLAKGMRMTIDYLTSTKEDQRLDVAWNAMEDVLCYRYSRTGEKPGIKKWWIYMENYNHFMLAIKRRLRKGK